MRRPSGFVLALLILLVITGSFRLPERAAATHGGTHVSGTIGSNATWTVGGSPYVLDGNVTVASGVTLTIEPGVVVKFNGQYRTFTVRGTLSAVGTPESGIVFTSIQDDSVGGDSGGDGPTPGAPGQWYEIGFKSGSTSSLLKFVEVRYGGYGSANWAYGAINVGASSAVTIEDSRITDSDRSGIKINEGGATVRRSVIQKGGNGISVNQGWVAVEDRTFIQDNSGEGVWFNLTSSYDGPASSIMESDVTDSGGEGIELQVASTLPTSKWPHGNRNNIFANAGKQLKLSGYHPPSYTKQYAVDWTGNYWGSDVHFWYAPSLCSGTDPYSPGHLGYTWSNPAPEPGGLVPPPSGPISYTTFKAGTGDSVVYCAYDRFKIDTCQLSTSYIMSDLHTITFSTPQPLETVLDCAADGGVSPQLLQSNVATTCPDTHVGYFVDPLASTSDVLAGYEPMVSGLVDELNVIGDFSCSYAGSAPVNEMVAIHIPTYDPRLPDFLEPDFECSASDPWEPSHGRIDVFPSYRPGFEGQRYVYQLFRWDVARLDVLKGCGNGVTIEADAVFNNFDGQQYLGEIVGWASNLPDDYKDTQAFDCLPLLPCNRRIYTVGSADVQRLQANFAYYTLIRTKPGNASSDTAALNFQGGTRLPEFCHKAWCVEPKESKIVIPEWGIPVPGSVSWD